MLALALVVSLQLGADLKPEGWVVVSRRSGVAKPQALEFARTFAAALNTRGVPTPTPVDDATSCNAKVPCLVDLAQKKGAAVLIAVEAGSALDDVVLHAEALSIDEFGKKLATFDYTGPAAGFGADLKDKVEEFFAPAVRNVLGLGQPVAKKEPPPEEKKPEPVAEKPPEQKPEPVAEKPVAPAPLSTEKKAEAGFGPGKIAGIGAMAVGVVLLAVSVGMAARTSSLVGGLNADCPMRQPCNDPGAYQLYSAAGSSQSASIGLLVSGLVVAAAGAVLFFVDPFGGGTSATVAPSVSSDGMSMVLAGHF